MIDLPPEAALVANTPRLRLVPVTPADAEEMFVILNDQRLHRHIGGLPPAQAELAERYRALSARRSADGREVLLTWLVRLVPLGEAIGEVRAAVTDEGVACIGCTVGHRYWGHGFAGEALVAMARLLETHLFVTTLEALVPPGHDAGQRVAAGLGMKRDGQGAGGWDRWLGKTALAFELAGQPAVPKSIRRPRRSRRAAPAPAKAAAAPAVRRRPAAPATRGRRRGS
ncbi:MAG TPA: GNAT family N-acetyltransferase [Candidatus Dormibacteraeota bacterium]